MALFIFDTDILLPKRAADPGAPVEGEAWYNTTTHEFKYQTNAATIVIGAGLSNEQVQDIVGAFFADSTHLDVTYDDAGNIISAVIKPGSITLDLLSNINASRFLGRATGAGAGAPTELTSAQAKAILALVSADLSDFTESVQDVIGALLGDTADLDFTYDDTGAIESAVIKPRGVTYAHMPAVATGRLLGRTTAGAGDTEVLTAAQVKAIIGVVAADIADFVANARTSISAVDSATLDLNYNNATGVMSGNVLDSPTIAGQTIAQLTATITNAIVDAAPGTLDTLNELAAALGDDPNFAATINGLIALRARQFEITVGDGALTQIDVPHNLNNFDLEAQAWDAAAPRAKRNPGMEKPDANTLRLTFNVAPALNSVRVIVQAK
jgi:hypothetical protein